MYNNKQRMGLVEQEECIKQEEEEALLHLITIAIRSIWSTTLPHSAIHPLIRRSRTTPNTIKITLYYIHQARREIRHEIQEHSSSSLSSSSSSSHHHEKHPILSPIHIFLAALMVASKFLLDRNYSNKAWAKISGLTVEEINHNERLFLRLIDYRIHLDLDGFQIWSLRLNKLMIEQNITPTKKKQHSSTTPAHSPPPLTQTQTATTPTRKKKDLHQTTTTPHSVISHTKQQQHHHSPSTHHITPTRIHTILPENITPAQVLQAEQQLARKVAEAKASLAKQQQHQLEEQQLEQQLEQQRRMRIEEKNQQLARLLAQKNKYLRAPSSILSANIDPSSSRHSHLPHKPEHHFSREEEDSSDSEQSSSSSSSSSSSNSSSSEEEVAYHHLTTRETSLVQDRLYGQSSLDELGACPQPPLEPTSRYSTTAHREEEEQEEQKALRRSLERHRLSTRPAQESFHHHHQSGASCQVSPSRTQPALLEKKHGSFATGTAMMARSTSRPRGMGTPTMGTSSTSAAMEGYSSSSSSYLRQPVYRAATPPLGAGRPMQSCGLQESRPTSLAVRPPSVVARDRAWPPPPPTPSGAGSGPVYPRLLGARPASDSYRAFYHHPLHHPLPPYHTPSSSFRPAPSPALSSSRSRRPSVPDPLLHPHLPYYPLSLHHPSYYPLNPNPPTARPVY